MTGLEALQIVERDCEDLEQVPYGEFALIEKSLKALEIIKKKTVDILDIKTWYNYEHYCRAMEDSRLRKDWWLTEEEFNLLKEVLE